MKPTVSPLLQHIAYLAKRRLTDPEAPLTPEGRGMLQHFAGRPLKHSHWLQITARDPTGNAAWVVAPARFVPQACPHFGLDMPMPRGQSGSNDRGVDQRALFWKLLRAAYQI